MALSGLDIYKLLPKKNCRECGFSTCLAFAMQLAKNAVALSKCPYLSDAAKTTLEEASLPAIRLVSLGSERVIRLGNETVLFRHEEKFHHPTAIGIIIEDSLSNYQIIEKLEKIHQAKFERVGETLELDLVAIKQTSSTERFLEVIGLVAQKTKLVIVLLSYQIEALSKATAQIATKKPLIYLEDKTCFEQVIKLALTYKTPLLVCGANLEEIAALSMLCKKNGLEDIVLCLSEGSLAKRLWYFTQMRRLALKKKERAFGYPVLAMIKQDDLYLQTLEAGVYIAKYASIVLLEDIELWQALSLLTLRQNIYTDPQKPLQVEPKIYPVSQPDEKSLVLVTTNFSLTYYTVLGEVEASKVPAYLLSVDTEGMSVLTAWAAEKFNPEKITSTLETLKVKELVRDKRLVIPGYVAVMSGELEERSGWQVIVGPKEASGIPAFLKNLSV